MAFNRTKKPTGVATLVGRDTSVHGDIQFTGRCHIDGYVRGNVRAVDDEPDSILTIAEGGCVEGAVTVPQLELSGTVKGDVFASAKVELSATARVVGNVQYNLIEMAIGAEVNGKLIHQSEGKIKEEPEPTVKIEVVTHVKAAGE
jgi:cytoskeletal protein CcmA (bactofilin family)